MKTDKIVYEQPLLAAIMVILFLCNGPKKERKESGCGKEEAVAEKLLHRFWERRV